VVDLARNRSSRRQLDATSLSAGSLWKTSKKRIKRKRKRRKKRGEEGVRGRRMYGN